MSRAGRQLICATIVVCIALAGCKRDKRNFVTIGTGGVTGIYYPTGVAICRMLNSKSPDYGIKATVESTSGSVYNVNAVLNGDLVFGVVQSDRQYQAYNGLAEWAPRGRQSNLRSVFSIHPESITLVASVDSGIEQVGDMKGRRVNLGNRGSGQLQNSRDVLAAAGLSESDIRPEYVKAVEAPGLLQDGRVDAFFYTVGHPNSNIQEATSGRVKVRIVPIEGAAAEMMLQQFPYYAESLIPNSFYRYAVNNEDAPTVGVKATFVTSASVDDDIVYAITKEVFENFNGFKALHPAYQVLTKENMLEGLSAPVHPGALKYYREVSLDTHIDPELILE